jgi:FemAB-related protein (PEP-CTERM system-associated)
MRVVTWDNGASWDAYVEGQRDASNYQRWTWRAAIADTYGHTPYYLAAVEGGAIRGALPLFLIRSKLFGNSLVSAPFFSYGGPVASCREARESLLARASGLAAELGVGRIELRQGTQLDCSWLEHSSKVAMEVPLPASSDDLWKGLSSRLRNKIRHAEKRGFTAEYGWIESVPSFYSVFAPNMRNLGTPVYPRQWFENLCRCAPKTTQVLILRDGRRPVGAAFLSSFRDVMEAPWICSTPEARRDYSSVLLYWTFLKQSIEAGYRRFDLGRCTPGGGTHAFKRLWGCTERTLHWYYWLAPGHQLPELRPESRKFSMAVQMWKHLPLWVANSLGPRIVRSLP